ncbi:hypothetical protein ACFC58_41370 [Kitasatospora purpeofusca]|uniref:hypothetical protein n=1 Tax=Kitasatospora purpeofusca TaxID=67352 RepID=UPI0035DEBB3D
MDWIIFEMATFTLKERIDEADGARLSAEARRGRGRERRRFRPWFDRRPRAQSDARTG